MRYLADIPSSWGKRKMGIVGDISSWRGVQIPRPPQHRQASQIDELCVQKQKLHVTGACV